MRDTRGIGQLLLLAGVICLSLLSCGPRDKTGPEEPHWDREICERCRMAVSDHSYSAQIRGNPPEKRTQIYWFDDIGCAVLWLNEQSWKDDPRTEMWVTDCVTGEWIDAHTCAWLPGHITPMDFQLGARASGMVEAGEDVLDYTAAVAHIHVRMIEKKKKKESCCDEKPPFMKKAEKEAGKDGAQ